MPAPAKLKKRKDFVKVSRQGVSLATQSIVMQAIASSESSAPRIGYTTTKRIGNAVVRNRCRRRLRAVAATFFEQYAQPNTTYVLIGRFNTSTIDFATLCKDFSYGIKKLNKLLYGESKDAKQDSESSVSTTN